jgi:c-di-GMP-related signal transduction protein
VIAQSIEEDDDFRSISSVGFSCYQGNMAGRPAVWSPA